MQDTIQRKKVSMNLMKNRQNGSRLTVGLLQPTDEYNNNGVKPLCMQERHPDERQRRRKKKKKHSNERGMI